jgi:hypothetical protein
MTAIGNDTNAMAHKELGQRSRAELESLFGNMYTGWDRGVVVTQERFGDGETRFSERPMTPLELSARYVAAEIGANIYEIANRAAFAPIITFSQIQAHIGPVFEDTTAEIERLKEELARTERNRDMWKGQCERQAEQLRAYRAITGPSEESTQICTSDRTAVWSQAVEACAKVAENYVPGPAGHPYEHVKHDICVGIARKLRSLYLSPERVREVYPDLQKPSHAEQTAGGSNLQSTSEPTNAMAPGFYGCRLPPGGCGCPQDVRHKCRHAHWVTSGEPCR